MCSLLYGYSESIGESSNIDTNIIWGSHNELWLLFYARCPFQPRANTKFKVSLHHAHNVKITVFIIIISLSLAVFIYP